MARLDKQKAPTRVHARTSNKKLVRGYASLPHAIWGDAGGTAATRATAGIPGTWSPTGAVVPLTPAAMAQSDPVTVDPSPETAWTTGQYVQTQTAGVAGRASWSGTSWVSGAAP